MKKRLIIILIASVVGILLILLAYNIIKFKTIRKEEILYYREKSYEYLYEKYGKEATFLNNGTYYDSVYFYSMYFENEDKNFQVRAIPSVSTFSDDYILRLLDWEVSALIENICHKYYTNVDCTTHIIHNIDDEEILEPYYRNQQSLIYGIQPDNKIYVHINIYQDNHLSNQENFHFILGELNELDFKVDEIELCLYNHKGKLQSSQEYKKINDNYHIVD